MRAAQFVPLRSQAIQKLPRFFQLLWLQTKKPLQHGRSFSGVAVEKDLDGGHAWKIIRRGA